MPKQTPKKALAPIPEFKSEEQEREFWEEADSTAYVDWSKAERVRLPKLKPSSRSISLRLPVSVLDALRVEAHRRDVPYQSLIKVWLTERLRSARHK
jgi:predicted DNA binding CopG/RHH family protein